MGTSRECLKVFAVGLFTALFSQQAGSWDIGQAWTQLVDAASDVATLGQHGRDRDRERAEQQLREAEQARAAAEVQRRLQIEALTKDVELLRNVTKSFESTESAINRILALQSAILDVASQEQDTRNHSMAVLEKVRDFLRHDNNDFLQLVQALNSTQFLSNADLKRAFNGQSTDPKVLETIKDSESKTASALQSQITLMQQSKLTEQSYVETAISDLKSSQLTQLIGMVSESKARLETLRNEVSSERTNYRGQLNAQVDALATLSGTDINALKAKYEADLMPNSIADVVNAASKSANEVVVQVSRDLNGTPQVQKVCLSFALGCFDAPRR
ncbi:hypothetical protein [Caballeronia concitans]|uniref:Uncharacterized protein n=1 Tax=Caballeronia concitans TaxID=1777133 RepID=A0A658R5W9_9BURK|nr:hypothetical protein [Caballeronia concitans]SAL52579.1 hypothetical protein AWB72_05612 [Caballeronia concitans]